MHFGPVAAVQLSIFPHLWYFCMALGAKRRSLRVLGRHVHHNSISGSLPTEIGKLNSILHLYDSLSLQWLWHTLEALQGSMHLGLVAAMQSISLHCAWHEGAERLLHLLAGSPTIIGSQARCQPRSAS